MLHRLAAVLLTVAIALAGVTLAPCRGGALCQPEMQMECCKSRLAGISAAHCCTGSQKVRQAPLPATSERSLQRPLSVSTLAASTAHAPRSSSLGAAPRLRIDLTAAPPGGSLIAQHTSLLL